MSLFAIKSVGSDYLSVDWVQVTLGLWGPPLDPSVVIDYTPSNGVTAPAPGLFACASFTGNPWPGQVWPARLGPAGDYDSRRVVELQFEEADIISTRRRAYVVEVMLSAATVSREMASGLSPGSPDFRDEDPARYIVPGA